MVVDDDVSIHQIWQERFSSKGGVTEIHFSTPQELKEWVENNRDKIPTTLFLMDYELLGYQETGLSLIEALQISAQSILVTSRYEEKSIADHAKRIGVRLLPKGLAGYIPIELKKPLERPDGVLIDDDSLVHMTWKARAKQVGTNLRCFFTADEFFAVARTLDFTTPIYVDSNLGNGIKGEEVSKEIHALGFTNIYLASGYEPDHFPPMGWIVKILGKDAPF
ncbi:hypothetical protein WDW86_03035 [Bdellovibrionota bacterium FG-2]